MNQPELTIIIPTLKRPDTLYWTIRTVLNQEYDNYSIIISDNYSNDNTPEIVASFQNKKIRYINPGRRLSMSRHWEFALQHINSGYVTILGDDDGMLPGALQRLAKVLQRDNAEAIGWRFGNFNWKGLPPYFMIPMGNYYRVIDSTTEIQRIFKENIYQTIRFPSLYGGFINIELIKKIRDKFGGQFFHSRIPDFFSGAIIAASVEKYIRLEFPLTINATSKHSTGFATINKSNNQSAFIDLVKGEDNIPFHHKLIFIRSNAVPIAESMLQVHDLIPSFPQVDIKKLLGEIAKEAAATQDENKFIELVDGIKAISFQNGMQEYSNELVKNISHQPVPDFIKKKFSPLSLSLYVDISGTDIENVQDACNFSALIISPFFYRVNYKVLINYTRFMMFIRYIYLKLFSRQKQYL